MKQRSPTGWQSGRRHWWLVCAMGLLVWIGGGLAAEQGGSQPKFREYEVKAAFLLNFLQFVDWPATSVTNTAAPLVIGVLGEDPFGSVLDETIKGETVQGRPLQVKREKKVAHLKDCHLVFITRSERGQLKESLRELRDSPTLTVSDLEAFCKQGGMIGLLSESGKIRFEINQAAAEAGGLKISSKLLRLGRPMAK